MADEPKADVKEDQASDAQENATETKSSSKKIIIIAAAGVLLVALAITTALLLLGGDEVEVAEGEEPTQEEVQSEQSNAGSTAAASTAAPSTGAPKFYNIRPAFIVNIPSQGRIRYLQIEVDIMTRQDKVVADLEAYWPLIKNELVQLFSNQDYTALQAPEGREKLRKDALERVQKVMRDQAGVEGIEQVLFTRFVTQ